MYPWQVAIERVDINDAKKAIKEYGEETIDLSKGNTVKSIIDSELFQIGYNKSWLKSTTESGKLLTCSKFCGSNVNTEILSTKKSVQRSGEYNV